ncbi:dihydrolipoyl dehydrogenase family protein [Agrococcus baldri]|uniref:Pyridine nucleotide-disulfide oxidoreductase n=1 Tax=Agrococcus baldri TaxID=153730 RepID=A0AA87RDU2_9MICO|nr:FAD-dependent oxidoreductase [Agrococcus baldri]GEK80857.1 pyridine nucleotide-disulfide oxidoreductase [Agrococcus baldri]
MDDRDGRDPRGGELMTARLSTEVLVIGWGKGGKTLARALGRAGRRVVLVERDDTMIGGTCINVACVPTKALVIQAERRRPEDDPDAYLARAIASRDTLVERLREANRQLLATVDAVTLVRGEASFTGPHTVRVTGGDEELEIAGEVVVVNTGTVPRMPGIDGQDGPRVHDSTSIQHLDSVPDRLAIVGAGTIALEFASMFARFGSAVTIIARGAGILPDEDDDVRASVEHALADAGVAVLADASTTRIDDGPERATVVTSAGEVAADAVLLATGRAPATAALDLAAADIRTDERGFVIVDDLLRTSSRRVWAVGDVTGGQQLTPISLDDSRIVHAQLTGAEERNRADRVAVPTAVFTTPPLARVGLTEREARERGLRVLVGAKPVATIAAMPRPKALGETHGIIKVVVDAETDLVLGAALHSVDAQEVINLVALAMRAGVTAAELRDGIWTHPSSTEALNEVLGELR